MKLSVVGIFVGIFVLLMVGLFFSTGGGEMSMTRQITNPEGSTLDMTDNQGAMLALLSAVITGSIFGMGATLYVIFWFLNRNVTRAQEAPNQPMELLAIGNNEEVSMTSLVANNALLIVGGLGAGMILLVVAVLLLQ